MTKINQEEYEVLKGLDDKWKWIARDRDRMLFVFNVKPRKEITYAEWDIAGWDDADYSEIGGSDLFHFIQWEDEEPHNIAELIEEYESEETEVKKDIEWLRKEIENMAYTTIKRAYMDDYISISKKGVLELIDQLDEPDIQEAYQEGFNDAWNGFLKDSEILSQEWIDEHSNGPSRSQYVWVDDLKELLVPKQEITFEQAYEKLREESILSEKSFDYYWNCISDNVEIDEPGNLLVPKQEEANQAYKDGYEKGKEHATNKYRKSKPVIPQFVADYIQSSKDIYRTLFSAMRDALEDDENKVHEWLWDGSGDDSFQTFARAWLDGYEVEEEQKYYVVDNKYRMMLVRMMDGKTITEADPFPLGELYDGERKSHRLTEQEIKDYDERYWPFAVKVEELEE